MQPPPGATWVILDGLDDPRLGRQLSLAWRDAGFDNAVDVAGMRAWLRRAHATGSSATANGADAPPLDESQQQPQPQPQAMTELDVDAAASVARRFGIELRDRAGQTFRPAVSIQALRDAVSYEYKARFATALVYGLPALALYYLAPILVGGSTQPRGMLYPWLFQMLLVGWTCFAAGWPFLWQGALSLRMLRLTGDALTALLMVGAFFPPAIATLSLAWRQTPWPTMEHGATFHAAIYVVIAATLHRWLAHRAAHRLAGRMTLIPMPIGLFVGLWGLGVVGLWLTGDPHLALATGLMLPPLAGLLAVSPWAPGPQALLPVAAFAIFMLLAPGVQGSEVEGVRIEIAFGFALLLILVTAWGWRRLQPLDDAPPTPKLS